MSTHGPKVNWGNVMIAAVMVLIFIAGGVVGAITMTILTVASDSRTSRRNQMSPSEIERLQDLTHKLNKLQQRRQKSGD
jgi:hypothetical protein